MTYQLMINDRIEQLLPCPACNNQKFQWLFVKDDRHFWRCTNCHLEKQHLFDKLIRPLSKPIGDHLEDIQFLYPLPTC